VIPGTVVESITIATPVASVFDAFARSDIRSVWSKLPGRDNTYELDFRVGGEELRTSTFPNVDATND
jgi:uncharacterized protein YndB with AHSA1/START domain